LVSRKKEALKKT